MDLCRNVTDTSVIRLAEGCSNMKYLNLMVVVIFLMQVLLR
jgi:hypothetical protein